MQRMVIAVGKLGSGHEAALFQHYAKQIRGGVVVHEIADAPASLPTHARKSKEAEALRKKVPEGATVVALDARGKTMTSEAFSALIAAQQSAGKKALCFIIGGQDGLDESLVKQADYVMAFGAMIWPHKLARVMLAEQLFRAQCIAANHPYHGGHA